MFNFLKAKINQWRYNFAAKKINKMPIEEQIKIGRNMYKLIYSELSKDVDIERANYKAMTVTGFTCKYPGHVSCIKNNLSKRIADKNDLTCFQDLIDLGDDIYLLAAGVVADDENKAILLSDASCMESILQVNTVRGNFRRASISIDTSFDNVTAAISECLLEGAR